MHGYGPKRAQAHLAKEYASLTGYSTDPASVFPVLRSLLSEHYATISSSGEIAFDDLHFTNPLLRYWPGQRVTLRRFLYTESAAWIYLDGEILCEARAKELRNPDGTYRKTKYRSSKKE